MALICRSLNERELVIDQCDSPNSGDDGPWPEMPIQLKTKFKAKDVGGV